jgi:hypothetical protein
MNGEKPCLFSLLQILSFVGGREIRATQEAKKQKLTRARTSANRSFGLEWVLATRENRCHGRNIRARTSSVNRSREGTTNAGVSAWSGQGEGGLGEILTSAAIFLIRTRKKLTCSQVLAIVRRFRMNAPVRVS